MISRKYGALLLLVMQNTLIVAVLRYTRTVDVEGPRYISSSVIFLGECLKIVASVAVIFVQSDYSISKLGHGIYEGLLRNKWETVKIALPSGLYSFQNNLLFLSANYLDAATYQVTYQLKILTTAVFSVILLKKSVSRIQWISLCLLMVGVALVQFPDEMKYKSDVALSNHLFGLLILLTSCTTSGLAGVSFEFLLKKTSLTLWIRNIQMALFGMFFSFLTMMYSDGEKIKSNGLCQGYNSLVVLVLVLHAFGGILVSCVVKYADNVIKGFATSLAIIFSSLISYFVFNDLQPTWNFFIGATLVLTSTILYGQRDYLSTKLNKTL